MSARNRVSFTPSRDDKNLVETRFLLPWGDRVCAGRSRFPQRRESWSFSQALWSGSSWESLPNPPFRNLKSDFHRTRLLVGKLLSSAGLLGVTPVVPCPMRFCPFVVSQQTVLVPSSGRFAEENQQTALAALC